jgi:hypothetical protein
MVPDTLHTRFTFEVEHILLDVKIFIFFTLVLRVFKVHINRILKFPLEFV